MNQCSYPDKKGSKFIQGKFGAFALQKNDIMTLKYLIFLFLQCSLLVAQSNEEKESLSLGQLKSIESIIDEYLEENDIPALSLGILRNGEAPVFINKGKLKLGTEEIVDEHTTFQLASLSKMFTGLLTNYLAREGKS